MRHNCCIRCNKGRDFSSSARRVRQLSEASGGAGRGIRNGKQELRGRRREGKDRTDERKGCQEWKWKWKWKGEVEVEVEANSRTPRRGS